MKAVYMVMHRRKPHVSALAERIAQACREAGLRVYAEAWLHEQLDESAQKLFESGGVENCDGIMAVGGDGTLLRANALAVAHHIPLMGVNVGTVGFLTEVEPAKLTQACQRLARDEYDIEERMMLKAQVGERTMLALNDVVVSRGGYARLIGVNAYVDGEAVGRYIADGLIVATPTGSTGYSLSAGGPIVSPTVECVLLTPICAHSLQHRPVVTAATQTITLALDRQLSAQVSVDGWQTLELRGGETLTITRAECSARFIRLSPRNFFSMIRVKLSEWSCGPEEETP